ncbi:PAS domain-containing protein [Methylobacterium sp. C33D]
MAARIRDFAWEQTPLGASARWPERLRVMVEQVLGSPLVASLVCGPERLLIYNDAAARLYGDRHPAGLGRPLARTFPAGWATVAAFYARAFAGEAVQVAGQPLAARVGGAAEDVFDALLMPVRDADGQVMAVHMTGLEIGERLRAEAKLRTSEARYRDLFDAIDEGFCTIEVLFDGAGQAVDYRFLSVNAAFEQQTGLRDAVGQTIRALAPDLEPHWFETYGRIVRTGKPERFEDRADALGRWYEVYAFPIGAPERRQVAVLFKDILQRKRAEDRLRASEERFRAFVTASADVIYRMSPDWSELRVLEGRGFLADTVTPNDDWLSAYIDPADQPRLREAIRRAIRSKTMFELEHPVRQADGSLGWALSRAVPLLDDDGEIREWFGAASDVTARKRAEDDLRASEERFRGLVEGFGQFSWEASAEGVIEVDSPGWRAFTGQRPDEWLGRGWVHAIHPDDRALTEAKWRQAVATRTAVDHEYRLWHAPSASWRWSNVRAVPITYPDGSIRKWSGVNIDVTDHHRLLARQEVLINELQHRTRNLLGVVSAVAGRTLRQGSPVEAFEARLLALSRAQGLLSQYGSDTVEVGALVRAELAAYVDGASDRITVAGPEVHLTARQVQNFALAVHELTTNAVKYGALQNATGRLRVTWAILPDSRGRRILALDWTEGGVTIDPGQVTRSGYGTELIQEALAYALQATVDYRLGADGVRCRIEMPVS